MNVMHFVVLYYMTSAHDDNGKQKEPNVLKAQFVCYLIYFLNCPLQCNNITLQYNLSSYLYFYPVLCVTTFPPIGVASYSLATHSSTQ